MTLEVVIGLSRTAANISWSWRGVVILGRLDPSLRFTSPVLSQRTTVARPHPICLEIWLIECPAKLNETIDPRSARDNFLGRFALTFLN